MLRRACVRGGLCCGLCSGGLVCSDGVDGGLVLGWFLRGWVLMSSLMDGGRLYSLLDR